MEKRKEYMRNYMKLYRQRNRDKLIKYEAKRNQIRSFMKRTTLPEIKHEIVPCLINGCKRVDAIVYIKEGIKVRLCDDHKHVNIFA